MPARILPAFARPVAALTAAKHRAPLLSVVSHHALAYCDLQMACDLSDLLRESISQGCRNTYKCGFDSLTEFCSLSSSTSHKLSALPVDAITLCAWMMYKAQSIKVKSVVKYICGIRFAHILEGHEWSLHSPTGPKDSTEPEDALPNYEHNAKGAIVPQHAHKNV